MTLDATRIQPAPDAGHFATPSPAAHVAQAAAVAAHATARSHSLLTRCVAWLFGIEALLRELDELDRQARD
jgi:hypothetical protein